MTTFAGISLIGCDGDGGENGTIDAESYYALQVGYYWHYEDQDGDSSADVAIEEIDELTFPGHRLFVWRLRTGGFVIDERRYEIVEDKLVMRQRNQVDGAATVVKRFDPAVTVLTPNLRAGGVPLETVTTYESGGVEVTETHTITVLRQEQVETATLGSFTTWRIRYQVAETGEDLFWNFAPQAGLVRMKLPDSDELTLTDTNVPIP